MNFANQIWLYLAPALFLVALALFLHGLRKREHLLTKFAARRLLDQLTEKAALGRTLIKALLGSLGIAAIAIALARPQYGIEWSERKARGLDIIFVLDSSKSMLATDLRPNRLTRAKLAVLDLLERLESDRVGLVAFAGQAFLQTPPTLDYAAFRESLESVGPESLSRGGSDLGRALEEANKAFPVENNVKAVILLTDGEDLGGEAIETAKKISEEGIRIFAIGIGTAEGTYLQVANAAGEDSYLRDSQGQPVRSRLDEATLQEMTTLTGGQYQRLEGNSLEFFYTSVIDTLPRNERDSEMQEIPIERYQWPLTAAFLFFVAEIIIRRRRSTGIATTGLFLLAAHQILLPTPLKAEEAPLDTPLPLVEPVEPEAVTEIDPKRIYNDGREAILAGDYPRADACFNEAVSESQDFDLQRDALYNQGHNHFQSGEAAYRSGDFQQAIDRWKQSESAFRSALQIDPEDTQAEEDARLVEARRKALEEIIEEQSEQEEESSNEEQENSNEESENGEDEEQEPSEGGESEQEDSGQNGDNNTESENDESSEDNQNSDSEESSENNTSEDPAGADNAEEDAEESSDSQSSNNETDEEEDEGESSQPLPENPSSQTDEEPSDQASSNEASQLIEGMTPVEASALLDSMRDSEQLLPFVEQDSRQPGRQKPIQDW